MFLLHHYLCWVRSSGAVFQVSDLCICFVSLKQISRCFSLYCNNMGQVFLTVQYKKSIGRRCTHSSVISWTVDNNAGEMVPRTRRAISECRNMKCHSVDKLKMVVRTRSGRSERRRVASRSLGRHVRVGQNIDNFKVVVRTTKWKVVRNTDYL